MSSISRAFTQRRAKKSDPSKPFDRKSSNGPGDLRLKISSPVQLLHTTNMLSYNAPDIVPRSVSSTLSAASSLTTSGDESDGSASTAASTPPLSPEAASSSLFYLLSSSASNPKPTYNIDHPPVPISARVLSPVSTPTHAYSTKKSTTRTTDLSDVVSWPSEPPAIPKRSPSHTKMASFEAMARSRSLSQNSRMSKDTVVTKSSFNWRSSSSSSTGTAATAAMSHLSALSRKPSFASVSGQRADDTLTHPFVQELAQVSELAAEYGAIEPLLLQSRDEDEAQMASKGLCKLTADDYIEEIRGLLSTLCPEWTPVRALTTVWI